ncbi:MAG: aminotransferase class V-fold PLP-dependent enzyme [Rudaea sp.]
MPEHGALRSLFLLRADVIFLNHGSFGATPRPVFQEYQRWQLELERQPVEFLGRQFEGLMARARSVLADYVQAGPDELVYVPNATTGLNVVARSLALQPGDEVLATDHEYGALDRTWRFICAKRGAVYRQVPVPVPVTTHADFVERFWSSVTPRTRAIFLSHITSPTALIFPVKEICRRAREAGIISIVDGAHALGQIPLDLSDLGADFYSSNAHKWLLAPKGSAFLYARRERQYLVEPLVVSWGWKSERPSKSRFIDEQEWQGTRDIAAYLSVPAALEFTREHDWDRVREECHDLACYARRQVSALTGLEPLSPDAPEWFAQMLSLPLPPCDGEALKARLYDEFRIEVPIITWNNHQLIRISVQAYNIKDDVDALNGALRSLLPQVAKGV